MSTTPTNIQNAIDTLSNSKSDIADAIISKGVDVSESDPFSSYALKISSISISYEDVISALGYTPYNSTNPSGYTSNVGTVTSVNNVAPVNGNVTLSIPTVDQTYSGTSANAQSGVAVKSAIDTAISTTYKAAGSVAFANRPSLSSSIEGYVYNVSDSFTTTNDFVEGSGKTYPSGTNIVCINTATSGSAIYKWDVLAGFIDLSGYQTTANLVTSVSSSSTDTQYPSAKLLYDTKTSLSTSIGNEERERIEVDNALSDRIDDILPSQTGNSGKFLTTNGSAVSWANVDALPSQTSQSGKFLTTNGTTASWANAPTEIEWATYGTTTFQQIKTWVNAGKQVLIKYNSYVFTLNYISESDNTCIFKTMPETTPKVLYILLSGSSWLLNNYTLQYQLPAGTSGNVLTYTGTAGSIGSTTLASVATSGSYNDLTNKPTAIPSQTGNSGKFLTTNGSAVSWSNVIPAGTANDIIAYSGTAGTLNSLTRTTSIRAKSSASDTYIPTEKAVASAVANCATITLREW